MDTRIERIPIPAAQRWENLRERALPVACLIVTVAACGWLWQRQGRVAPFVHGEVGAEIVEIRSPVEGELMPLDAQSDGQWPLFAQIEQGAVAARIQSTDGDPAIIDVTAPAGGVVTEISGAPGQWIAKGETILEIASAKPTFIVCHVPDSGASLPEPGSEVAVRLRGNGNPWASAKIQGIGPVVTSATVYDGSGIGASTRGLPVRIALPADLSLKPGALVDVRFPPAAPAAL